MILALRLCACHVLIIYGGERGKRFGTLHPAIPNSLLWASGSKQSYATYIQNTGYQPTSILTTTHYRLEQLVACHILLSVDKSCLQDS